MRALVIGAFVVAACGPPTVPIEQLDTQMAAADCAWMVRCRLYDTVDRCLASNPHGGQFAILATPSIMAAVASGDVAYDAVQAAECIDQHVNLSCSFADEEVRIQPSAICRGIFRAARKIGSRCAIDAECDSRRCSITSPCLPEECCSGACGEAMHQVLIGEDCSIYPCAPNGWCEQQVCVPLLPRGSPCFEQLQCDWGLDCLDTCQAPLHEGDPCGTFEGSPSCGLTVGLVCDPDTMTCGYRTLRDGDACDPGDSMCADGLCDFTTRQCVPYPRVGEPCAFACAAGAYCSYTGETSGGLCLPLVDDGSSCFGFASACKSGVCSSLQVCIEPPTCF